MKYRQYQEARDKSWETLLDCDIQELPVDIKAVCQQFGFLCYTYAEGKTILEQIKLLDHTKETDGFTVYMKDTRNYLIFYNQECCYERQRFTIAHELGHILLKHTMKLFEGVEYTVINREPSVQGDWMEQQANVFASRFLAPACVLHALKADTPEKIAKLCNISIQSATYRTQRMKDLEKRDRFYHSPLEARVQKKFNRFIKFKQRGMKYHARKIGTDPKETG